MVVRRIDWSTIPLREEVSCFRETAGDVAARGILGSFILMRVVLGLVRALVPQSVAGALYDGVLDRLPWRDAVLSASGLLIEVEDRTAGELGAVVRHDRAVPAAAARGESAILTCRIKGGE